MDIINDKTIIELRTQILMLSGIGPRSELTEIHGIEQVLDLPVGRNLQDHCQVPVAAVLGKPMERARKLGVLRQLNPLRLAQLSRKGLKGLLSNNGLTTLGVIHTPLSNGRRPGTSDNINAIWNCSVLSN